MPRTANNLLILQGYWFVTSQDATDPSGWTRVSATSPVDGSAFCNMWYRKATGGDAAPALAATGASRMEASLSEWTGWDGNAPTCVGTAHGTAASITVTGTASPGST